MYRAWFRDYSEGTDGWHKIQDIWDLEIDPVSVCGVEFYEQEARSARFSCLLDGWMKQYILSSALLPSIYKGYLRAFIRIYKDNQVVFSGFLKSGNVKDVTISEVTDLHEVQFTVTDALQLVKDLSEGMEKQVTANESYNVINELLTCLNSVISSNGNFFWDYPEGTLEVIRPFVDNQYDSSQWLPFQVQGVKLFDRADYDMQGSAVQSTYDLDTKLLKLSWTGNILVMTYIDYTRRVTDSGGNFPRLKRSLEKLKYARYVFNGIKIQRILPPAAESEDPNLVPLYAERSREAYFNANGQLVTTDYDPHQQVTTIILYGTDNGGDTYFGLSTLSQIAVSDLGIPNPADGDTIVNVVTSFGTTYYDGFGWYGDLEYVVPGQGYLFISAAAGDRIWAFVEPTGTPQPGMTVTEWLQSLRTLLQIYNCDTTTGSAHEHVEGQFTDYYDIEDGALYYTGFDPMDTVKIADDRKMSLMDWIKTLMQVKAVWIQCLGNALTLKNKVNIYNTDFTALPGEIVSEPQTSINSHRDDEFSTELSILQSGEAMGNAINNYYKAMMRNTVPWEMELTLDGDHQEVNVRYYYKNWMLYVMEAAYDIEKDETRIKALAAL